MNHKTKSVLLIVVLLAIVILIGILAGSGGITGATTAKSIACEEHSDCDDRIERTEDICRNPGTENSICVNKPRE